MDIYEAIVYRNATCLFVNLYVQQKTKKKVSACEYYRYGNTKLNFDRTRARSLFFDAVRTKKANLSVLSQIVLRKMLVQLCHEWNCTVPSVASLRFTYLHVSLKIHDYMRLTK